MTASVQACAACLRRTALIAALAGHVEVAWRRGRRPGALLALPRGELVAAVVPDQESRAQLLEANARLAPAALAAAIRAAGLEAVCRCAGPPYPQALLDTPDAPAVVHVLGGLGRLHRLASDPGRCAAIVGARRASPYGLDVARALGAGLGAAGATVVSGMAIGIDTAAHAGAVAATGATVAVLAGGADVAYPASRRGLHRQIGASGCVISELPPGFRAFRWSFPARNRLIAALASATVVVEAGAASGALITADLAMDLGREVGAVPGRITAPQAAGTNALLHGGAHVVRGPEDVLSLLSLPAGPAGRDAPAGDALPPGAGLRPGLQAVLARVAGGASTLGEAAGSGDLAAAMSALAELELLGLVQRSAGGRYRVPSPAPVAARRGGERG